MHIALAVFSILLAFILVIGLHEAGHALAARIFKVKIKRIAIGFGRPILRYTGRSGLEWVWGLWPVGGYVQLLNSRIEPVSLSEIPYCFDKQKVWKRIVILASGALANFIVALFALLIYFIAGFQQITPIIAKVDSPSAANAAGIKPGDQLLSINAQKTASWREVGEQFIINLGAQHVPVVVQSATGKKTDVVLDLSQWQYKSRTNALLAGIGITPDVANDHRYEVKGVPFSQAIYKAWFEVINILLFFLVIIKQLVTGMIPFAALLGPFGLFTEIVASFFQGLIVFLFFIANLSIAVGFINLFPVPGLDGGSIGYAIIEKIRGQPVSVALEILLQRLAVIVFCVLLVHLIMNDLQRYIQ